MSREWFCVTVEKVTTGGQHADINLCALLPVSPAEQTCCSGPASSAGNVDLKAYFSYDGRVR